MTIKYGFKEITPSNWLEPDAVLKGFVRMSQGGELRSITSDDYLHDILRPEFLESVPPDVKALFEVARGAMIYGYFFYPLYTLATEQLFRVAEAAVLHRCKDLGAPKSKKTFQQMIEWLIGEGVISGSAKPQWDAVRYLRNSASHPNSQSIVTPGNAIGMLEKIVRQVNTLFNGG
jgi:hypothetical protein